MELSVASLELWTEVMVELSRIYTWIGNAVGVSLNGLNFKINGKYVLGPFLQSCIASQACYAGGGRMFERSFCFCLEVKYGV